MASTIQPKSVGCVLSAAGGRPTTLKIKTLASGAVIICGSDMITYHGSIDEDGNYTVSKVPIGPATIVVVFTKPQVSVDPASFDDMDRMKRRLVKAAPKAVPALTPRSDPKKWFTDGKEADKKGRGCSVENPRKEYHL